MDFEFSADQEMLTASVRRFLADRAPIAYVRERYGADASGRDQVWTGLAELGVLGLLAPDAHGDAGTGMVDAAVVLEELGRAVCPAPFISSAIAATAVLADTRSGQQRARWLSGLADGSAVATLAAYEPARRYEWSQPETRASRSGEQWLVDGTKVHVPDATDAQLLLVTAVDDDDRLAVLAVEPGAGVAVATEPSIDGSRKYGIVTLTGAAAERLDLADASETIQRALDRVAVASVVDGVGAASRALELAVDYAKERVQFDRPIGSFQAVQHLCADMLRVVELGRAAGYYACWAADRADAPEAHRAATLASAFASDAFASLGGTAIQVFGGVGFTWEHDIHLYYKRLLSDAAATGGADEHLAELATIAIDEK